MSETVKVFKPNHKEALRACPVCKYSQVEVLRTELFQLPEGHPLSSGYDVVVCQQCGFVYADTLVSQLDYDRFYAQFSKYESTQISSGGDAPWDVPRLKTTAETIAQVVQTKDASVLDVGCASGGLLAQLKELGYTNLHGLDPSPACVQNVRDWYGIDAEAGFLTNRPEGWDKFDCVSLSHVLEHLQDLGEAVAALRQLVKPNGILYIEVPDASRYADFLIAPFQDFNTEHINHFSMTCLNNLLAQAGFKFEQGGAKTVLSAPKVPYPAIFGFYTKQPESGSSGTITKDTSLIEQLKRYITLSQVLLDSMEQRVKLALAKAPQIIVWGTGQLAMKLLAQTVLGQADIVTFVDGNSINWNRLLNGSPIVSPEELKLRGYPYPIIITSTIHQAAIAKSIQEQLHLPNEIVFLQ